MEATATAQAFVEALTGLQSDAERAEIRRYYHAPEPQNRVVGVRMKHILDFKAQRPRTTDADRAALYDLVLDRHDRLDSWDFLDRHAAAMPRHAVRTATEKLEPEVRRCDVG